VPRLLSQPRRVLRRRQGGERRHVRDGTGGGGEGADGAEAPPAARAQEGRRHMLRRVLRPPGRRRVLRRGTLLSSPGLFLSKKVTLSSALCGPWGVLALPLVAVAWCTTLGTPVEHLVGAGWCSGRVSWLSPAVFSNAAMVQYFQYYISKGTRKSWYASQASRLFRYVSLLSIYVNITNDKMLIFLVISVSEGYNSVLL
jgi:hypothetical protein